MKHDDDDNVNDGDDDFDDDDGFDDDDISTVTSQHSLWILIIVCHSLHVAEVILSAILNLIMIFLEAYNPFLFSRKLCMSSNGNPM